MNAHSAEKDVPEYGHPDAWVPVGSLRASDLGKWIMGKGLDRPKQIVTVLHNERTTAVHWYRDPVVRDAKSGMVAQHDSMVMLYREQPTSVTSPARCPIGAVPPETAARRGCAPWNFHDGPGCEVHGPGPLPPAECDDCGHHPEWSSKNGCRHPNCILPPAEGRDS